MDIASSAKFQNFERKWQKTQKFNMYNGAKKCKMEFTGYSEAPNKVSKKNC